MNQTITLTLPLPPNLANARMHWAKRHRTQCEWKERAWLMERQLRKQPRHPWPEVRVSAVLYLRTRMDDDNATARLKWCLDLLKEHRFIVDDKRPYLTLTGIPEQRVSKDQRVELTLERAA